MTTQRKHRLLSEAEYLAREADATIKHEYVDGMTYAMSGARNVHNIVASNVLIALGVRLRGQPCRAFNSDTKIRIRPRHGLRFYYPDAQVVCRQNSQEDVFQDRPVAIFEVISSSTRRIDEGEKKDAYMGIPSLDLYGIVESRSPVVAAFRRTRKGFVRELHEGLDAVLPMPELELELPFAEIYDGVTFSARRAR